MSQSVAIGIADEKLEEIVHGLSRVLADSYSLYLKTHNYHWNVVGPMFHSLHTMFEVQYTELALAVDEIAERIRALGAPAPATFRQFTELTVVAEDTDLLVRRLEVHEKTAWMLRSMLA